MSPSKSLDVGSTVSSNERADDKVAMQDEPRGEEYPSSFRLLAVIIALVLSMFLASLDMTIIATAIPKITDQFHSLNDVGWYGSAFFLTVSGFQASWGKAYKYFDMKSVFLSGIMIFELGSLLCGLAQSSTMLILGRAITGIGAAGVITGSYCIVAFAVPPLRRPAFTGIMGATYGVASVLGPLLGGAFTDSSVTWRFCFYVNLPIGAVSVAIIFFVFRTPEISKSDKARQAPLMEKFKQMDIPGMLTIMAAIVCLLLALQWAGVTKSWKSADVIGTLVGFGILMAVFTMVEYSQGQNAMIVPKIMRQRVVLIGSLFSFFLGSAFFVLLYYIPIYFQAVLGVSAEQSGIRSLALIVSETIFTILSGALISSFGYFAPMMIFGPVLTTVASGMVFTFDIESKAAAWIGWQVLAGAGIGLCFQAPIMAGQALAAPEDISTTTGLLMFWQTLGGALFVQAAQSAFSNTLVQSLTEYAPGLSPAAVVAVGATEIRKTFHDADLAGVLHAYMDGLKVAFALTIALSGCSVIIGLFTPWINIKRKQGVGAI